MVKIKDIALGLALTYSALTTYVIVNNNDTLIEEPASKESFEENYMNNQIGIFRQDGISYPVFQGPIGPRLGSIDYIGSNLTHSEKILMSEQVISYLPEVASRTITDIWEHRRSIANDITTKIESIIRGENENGTY